jgi:ABC-2 type transport system permease protein
VIWIALAVLLVSGTWGAHNTARLHSDQNADLARLARQEADWYAEVRIRAARYSKPSADPVPYWQDPTSASGFSRYFLRRFAAKPHLPLSVLSVGQSDLQPFAVPLRLETLFGGDRVYDYEPPRALSTGLFDLSFVLLFMAPLYVGWAATALGALERDQGILPSVAAQPISPRRWWLARLIALSALLIPSIALVVVVSLVAAGAPVIRAWPETIGAISLVAAHTLFWIAIAGWCVARGHSIVAAASIVTTIWLLLTVAIPIAGTLALQWNHPRPSPIADVNELRRVTDQVQREADAVVARHLVKRFGPSAASVNPSALDYSTRRRFMYPRVLQPVTFQGVPSCGGCPGRLTFTEYDAIPRFAFTDDAPSERSGRSLRTAAWLALVAIVVGLLSIAGSRTWALAP